MIIIGIDPSLRNTGVAVLEDGKFTRSEVIQSKKRGGERLAEIHNRLYEIIEEYIMKNDTVDVDTDVLIAFEAPLYHIKSGRGMIFSIGELYGVMKYLFYNLGLEYTEYSPSTLKKLATGKGNAQKDIVMQQVLKSHKIEFKTSHECDAFLAALCKWKEVSGL